MYRYRSLKLSCALTLASVLAFDLPTLAQRSTSMLDNQFFRDCQNVTEIVFVGVFPCLRRRGSNFAARQNISECDLLAEAAAQLAVERVNADPDVLPNITLRLYPTYVSTNEVKGKSLGWSVHDCVVSLECDIKLLKIVFLALVAIAIALRCMCISELSWSNDYWSATVTMRTSKI